MVQGRQAQEGVFRCDFNKIVRKTGASPKHEIRNSKQYQMTKIGMFRTNRKFGKFEFREFEFVSDFDIRISNLLNSKTCLVPAMPG
jgi:hypothetical protein